jgi:putative transposase
LLRVFEGFSPIQIEACFSLPTARVIRVLDEHLEWRSKPIAIRCDNGPEFISHEFTDWVKNVESGWVIFN